MKCENCKKHFPKEQKAFVKGKIVCQRCFKKLRIGKKNGKNSLQEEYREWLSI